METKTTSYSTLNNLRKVFMKQFLYHIALIAAGCCSISYATLEAKVLDLYNNSSYYSIKIKLFYKGQNNFLNTLQPTETEVTRGSHAKLDIGGKLVRRVDILKSADGRLIRDGKDVPGGDNLGLVQIEYNGTQNDIKFNDRINVIPS
jgi:hypothetical protein